MKSLLLSLLFIFIINSVKAQDFTTFDYNTTKSDMLWDIIEYDTGYLLTGYSQDSGLMVSLDVLAAPVLIKLSKSGRPVDTLQFAAFGNTEFAKISVYRNGYFYTFGYTNPVNDTFNLVVTKHDTLFNLIQRMEYPELKGYYDLQLCKTVSKTDSTLFLSGYHRTMHYTHSFIMNYNFNTMEIDIFKELPFESVITDLIVTDSNYYCALFSYNGGTISVIASFDKSFNYLSFDTLFVENDPITLENTVNILPYKDSLFICSGIAYIIKSSGTYVYALPSIMLNIYNSDFERQDYKFFYFDSIGRIDNLINTVVANNNNEFFIGGSLFFDNFYNPDRGLFIAKADYNLNTIWKKRIEITAASMRLVNMLPTDDGGVLLLYTEIASLGGAELHNSKLMKVNSNGEVTSIIDLQSPIKNIAVSLFPNPATTDLTISLEGNSSIKEISIYDVNGKLILQKQINSNNSKIKINQFAKGIYIIEGITDNGERFSRKFVKD